MNLKTEINISTSATFSMKVVFVVLLFFVMSGNVFAQQDTTSPVIVLPVADSAVPGLHSAHKATIYSMILPGLGQAYNRKYWKIPVIYVGFGLLAYNIRINNLEVRKFTEAYRYVVNKDSVPINNEYVTRYPNSADLLRGRDFYRRKLELNIIFSAVWYILNIIDATVDAHFFDYDISDDLSLRVDPVFIMPFGLPDRYASGFRLSMRF